jgi:peroxiredoxin
VLVFIALDCPKSNRYLPELNRLASEFPTFSLYAVLADPAATPEAARRHASDYGLQFPLLVDSEQRFARDLAIAVTPSAVVIDRDGKVAYRGRIDDRYMEDGRSRLAAQHHDLRQALVAIRAGRPVHVSVTRPVGCALPAPTVEPN